eukprot:1156248-Pelagomonas_calceolata.AAC.4
MCLDGFCCGAWRTGWCGTLRTALSSWRAPARCKVEEHLHGYVLVHDGGHAGAGPCRPPGAAGVNLPDEASDIVLATRLVQVVLDAHLLS